MTTTTTTTKVPASEQGALTSMAGWRPGQGAEAASTLVPFQCATCLVSFCSFASLIGVFKFTCDMRHMLICDFSSDLSTCKVQHGTKSGEISSGLGNMKISPFFLNIKRKQIKTNMDFQTCGGGAGRAHG